MLQNKYFFIFLLVQLNYFKAFVLHRIVQTKLSHITRHENALTLSVPHAPLFSFAIL